MDSTAHLTIGLKKFDHITPTLKKLHWLTVRYRIIFKILCITYKALHGLAPEYITGLIYKYHPTKSLYYPDQQSLQVPKMNLKTHVERSFSFANPYL